jgi:hypothetical protein
MKTTFWASIFLGLLVLGTSPTQACDPYCGYYGAGTEYRDLQQDDPYYYLHVIHYQLYRRPYQPYYPYYYGQVVTIERWPKHIRPWPQEFRGIRR